MNRNRIRSTRMRTLAAFTAVALGSIASAQAANFVDLHGKDVSKLNSAYQAATAGLGGAVNASDRHAEMLVMEPGSNLKLISRIDEKGGTSHFRYEQTINGLPVWGESIAVGQNADGTMKNLFGRMVTDVTILNPRGQGVAKQRGVNAELNADLALDIAKRDAIAKRGPATVFENESSREMIYIDDSGDAHRTFVVSYFADSAAGGNPTRPFVIMDAVSGAVLKQWDGLTHANGTGPGGNSKTGQYEWGSGGNYGYLNVTQSGTTCTMDNTSVRSVNLNGSTGSSTTAWSYTCPRNTTKAINGAYAPINDAHYFGGLITQMYPAYTGYNALSFKLIMRVHYGSSYENAFWNGSNMSFGDGASTFYPLVSVDVAGHEVSHGFTEQHSNLTYSGQSGGINEAFSDMGGEATEYYWKGSNDFLVGPDIFKGSGALRYMANPPQDGGSIDSANDYTSSMDVHYSSGVFNKAFYNLATTSGWGTPTAFKVFARANALYWTASTNFVNGACGVETAASDLGLSVADVSAAFAAVDVDCPGGGGGGGGGGTTALTKGVTVSGIGASTGGEANFTLVVPAGASNLAFNMSGGSGDADMYVKFGSAPTDSSYDCRPYANGNSESCPFASPSAGTYYVRLKAYSTFANVSLVGDYTVSTPNNAPVANFTFTTSGLAASFSDASSDSDGSIASRSWNFGDGSSSTSTNPSHTYSAAGTYTVALTVTDNDGATNSKSSSVTVTSGGGGGGGSSELTKGVAKTGLSASTGNSLNYTMVVPSGASNLTFTMSGGSGDADLYVKFGSAPTDSSYDCRPYANGNAETCTIAAPSAGTYYVRMKAYSSFASVSIVGDYQTSGGGGGGQSFFENTGNYTISDKATIESPIAVSGRSGNAPSTLKVAVDIKHTYIGDLIVNLVAPDGSTYLLHNGTGSGTDNIAQTYTVNASSEVANGTWKLRVYDRYNGDTGYIDSWSLQF